MNQIDLLNARSQVALAFFYGACFIGIFVFMAIYWQALSKFDVGLLTMFATGAMNQSKDASTFFFARHRQSSEPTPNPLDNPPAAPAKQPETKP